MSAEPAIDFGPVPPLVIGVSGVMQFEGDDRATLKEAVSRFLWQFVDHKYHTGEPLKPTHPDWRPLASTPIAILTSLAPGADLLLTEIAAELDAKYLKDHPGKLPWKFKVFAPMPFPLEQFKQASTFEGSRGTTGDKEKSKGLLDQMAKEHRAFFVPLKADHELCENRDAAKDPKVTQGELTELRKACLKEQLDADLKVPSRYRLRYRAAGEYIAAHSHLTIVLNEQVFTDDSSPDVVKVPVASELTGEDFPYGSRLILQLKRQGITPELLRSEVAFTWADSGPVVHFYTTKTPMPGDPPPIGPPPKGGVGSMTVLYPVDTRTKAVDLSHADDEWLWEAGTRFGTVLDQLDSFNRCGTVHARQFAEKEAVELADMLTLPAGVTNSPDPVVQEYHHGLGRLARARRRSSELADRVYSGRWKLFLLGLFLLTFCAALLVHMANHWHTTPPEAKAKAAHHDPAHPDDHPPANPHADEAEHAAHVDAHHLEAEFRYGLLKWAGLFLVVAYLWFIAYKGLRQEEFRFDFRALAEGVRVQVYWAAAGLAQSVPANYMQRQRNEMVWIRRAITALAAPYTRWANGFAALAEADQLAVLKSVVARWVRWDRRLDDKTGPGEKDVEEATGKAQAGYMERAGFMDHRAEQFWKRFGFDLTLMGLFHLVGWGWYLFHPDMFAVGALAWVAWVLGGLLVVCYLALWGWGVVRAWKNKHTAGHHHSFPPQAYCWRGKRTIMGAVQGGFVFAREFVYPYAHLWHNWELERKLPRRLWLVPVRELALGLMRAVNALLVVGMCTLISFGVCALLGCGSGPKGEVWWAITYGSLLLAGALSIAWPERHAMAEHSRQYESMWAMFQAAGRRLLGHLEEADEALAAKDYARFRGRVKAIQELLYHLGLQALDENAEWLILHRSRPLEPLMAG